MDKVKFFINENNSLIDKLNFLHELAIAEHSLLFKQQNINFIYELNKKIVKN